jgi:hypothetical protein
MAQYPTVIHYVLASLLYLNSMAHCQHLNASETRQTVLADLQNDPDTTAQQRIEIVVRALATKDMPFIEKMKAVESIRSWAEKAGSDFFNQLFHYSCRQDEIDSSDSRLKEEYAFILPRRFYSVADRDIVAVLAPHMGSRNERVRRMAISFAEHYFEGDTPPHCVDYEPYTDYLAYHKDAPPLGLVRYMFDNAPGQAVLSLALVYREHIGKNAYRDIQWSEHIIADAIWRKERQYDEQFEQIKQQAISELDNLSKHDAWWARLYAAEIIRLYSYPDLKNDAIVKRLQSDVNELVRSVAMEKPR